MHGFVLQHHNRKSGEEDNVVILLWYGLEFRSYKLQQVGGLLEVHFGEIREGTSRRPQWAFTLFSAAVIHFEGFGGYIKKTSIFAIRRFPTVFSVFHGDCVSLLGASWLVDDFRVRCTWCSFARKERENGEDTDEKH